MRKVVYKNIVLTGLLAYLPAFLFAQSQISQTNTGGVQEKITFPSPQAASLGQYGETRINHSNGTHNIVIPVTTVKEGSLELPVSLIYNYAGYRPAENPSWVGLGWALSAGGVITRTTKGGLRDEFISDGYLASGSLISSFVGNANPDGIVYNQSISGKDGMPDSFTFQFMGHSGKFVFDPSGVPKVISDQRLKIEYVVSSWDPIHSSANNIITKWTITDEAGVKYIFEDYEFSENGILNINGSNTPQANFDTSAWYLSEVINVKGDKITLNYTTPNKFKPTVYLTRQESSVTYKSGANIQGNYDITIGENRAEQIYLSNIQGTNWKLNFISSEYTKQEGLNNTITSYYQKLDKIELVDISASPDIINSTFDFAYNSLVSKKLHLTSFGQQGFNPHKFLYNDYIYDYYGGNTLIIDAWGFFNTNSKPTLIPHFGADLEPNLYGTSRGSLYKIIYPTGGSSSYSYELNEYSYIGNVLETRPKIVKEYRNQTWHRTQANGLIMTPTDNQTFTLTAPTEVTAYLYNNSDPSVQGCALITPSGSYIAVDKILQPGTYTLLDILNTWPEFSYCGSEMNTNGFNVTISVTISFEISVNRRYAGGIRVKTIESTNWPNVYPLGDINNINNINISFRKQIFNYEYESFSSGVIDADPKYDVQIIDPERYFKVYRSAAFNPYALNNLNYKRVVENILENYYNGTLPKAVVQYDYYSPADGIIDDNGKWEFLYYTSTPVCPPYFSSIQTHDLKIGDNESFHFARGMLKEKIEGTVDINGIYSHRRIASFGYTLQNVQSYPALYQERIGTYNFSKLCDYNLVDATRYIDYKKALYVKGGWVRKDSEIVREYNDAGDSFVETVTNYTYDNVAHLQPTKVRTTKSDGDVIEQKFKYPLDYVSVSNRAAFLTEMNTRHMINYPIERVEILDKGAGGRFVTGGSVNMYGLFSGNANQSNLVLGTKNFDFNKKSSLLAESSFQGYTGVSTTSAGSDYREVTSFTNYDTRGNLLSVRLNGNIDVSYLWGYSGQYPVAEIKNASYAAVVSSLSSAGSSHSALSNSVSSSYIDNVLSSVKSNLSNALVTSYLYQPLVGATKVSNPNGLSTYYSYDSLNRLQNIKDNNQHILKSYQYNYYPN